MLHIESDSESPSAVSQQKETSTQSSSPSVSLTSLFTSATPRSRSQVLLATARVKIEVASGRSIVVRALIDQGSEATFISENLAQTLRAKRIRMPVSISAVGGTQVGTVRHAANIKLSPLASPSPSLTTTAFILPSLTSYAPRRMSDKSALSHLSQLEWADPDPTSSDPIHALIGADLYSDLILEGVRKGQAGHPTAQRSIFGWIISGPLPIKADRHSLHISVHHCTSLDSLSDDLQRFWESEELPSSRTLSPQDEQCETHFRETHSRDSSGRYIVRLPFKIPPPLDIGQSRPSAARLLRSLSRRFHSQSALNLDYHRFMNEYEDLGHMRRAPEPDLPSNQIVYIPHHPVFRVDSITSRLRVVFNASCTTSNGTTLNDHLLSGPKLQAELPAIILQWRQCRFVCSADVAKMYRQILIDPRDVDYQRILWFSDSSNVPRDYQLLTVTYGTTCAPFLALRVLQCLADDEGDRFPLAASIIRKQLYVDDVLFGDNDIESLRQKRDQLISLLRCGQFELRKWASNSHALLEDIDDSNHGLACSKSIALDEKIKILGIIWNPARDNFQFLVNVDNSIPNSKRAILSTIAKLYDPLGWVTPVTVSAKIIMQQLWRSRIDWDDQIPASLLSRWQSFYTRLHHLNHVSLVRWTGAQPGARLELHGFADASTHAYAAVVYLKTITPSGETSVSLLAGKSRVAPIKPLTVPRLELSAALVLSRLVLFIRNALELHSVPCICWTDSTIVVCWLRSHPSRWTTFVANRVAQIQSNVSDAVWRHVPTESNPADCASRGLYSDELLLHKLWWHGPPWLLSDSSDWPSEPDPLAIDSSIEEKKHALHVSAPSEHWDLATRFSSWPRLIRVTAYLFKFKDACRKSAARLSSLSCSTGALSSAECSQAKIFWLKSVQSELFSEEINALRAGRNIASKSSIISLSPFLDDDNVLRVGGRLRHAPLPYDRRHPILLASHPITRLIISHVHSKTLHGGTQLTLSTLRKEYWILRSRSLVKSIIYACIPCVRE